ncbi:MAG: hypothetical protein ACLFTK_14570, partial [Anaerolineales bacterium]
FEDRLVNRTDDGFDGSLIGALEEDEQPVWLDGATAWAPDATLYFLRYAPEPGVEYEDRNQTPLALYRLNPAVDTPPEFVADMTGQLPYISVYDDSDMQLDGNMAMAPDAEQIAFNVTSLDPDAPNNGIYVMNIKDADSLRQIAMLEDFRAGFLADADPDARIILAGLGWNADSTALYVLATQPTDRWNLGRIIARVDVESGDVTTLTDLSDVDPATAFDLETDPALGFPQRWLVPDVAIMAPARDGVIYAARTPERSAVMALGPDDLRVMLEFDDSLNFWIGSVEFEGNATALLGGYLLER